MHRAFAATLGVLLLVLCLPCRGAEIFRWVDAQGVVHYSDHVEPGAQAESVQLRPEAPPAPPPPQAQASRPGPARPASAPKPERAELSILMYSSRTCGYCVRARNYFQQHGLAYQEVDINASAGALQDYRAHGGNGTPLIYINGRRVVGWSQSLFDRILADNGY